MPGLSGHPPRVTFGSGRAPAAPSTEQASHGSRVACREANTGTSPRKIAVNSVQERTHQQNSPSGWAAARTGLQGRAGHEREDFLKRPNLFQPGLAGQLEDKSLRDWTLRSEVFLQLVHDSFSKPNVRKKL